MRGKTRPASASCFGFLRSALATGPCWPGGARGRWLFCAHASGGNVRTVFVVPDDESVADWGGDHIQLRLFATGGAIEYDCSHGSIDAPLVVDREGRFDVTGT